MEDVLIADGPADGNAKGRRPPPSGRADERDRGLPLNPWGFLGLITAPLAAVALLVFANSYGFILFGDAEWYASALPALTSNQPLYDAAKLLPHPLALPTFWNQAPSTALFSLVQLLPGDRWLWGILMAACIVGGLLLIWPEVGPGGVMLLAPVVIAWPPVWSALIWANVNSAVFLLLAIALRFPRAAGLAIGVAAAVKLVPILGVAWLVGKRDWRGAITAVGILLAATLIVMIWKGPTVVLDFVQLRLNEFSPPGDGFPRWNPVEWLHLPSWVAYASAALIAVAAVARASISLAIIAMLLSVPSLHVHYLTWLLVPALCIWIPWVIAPSRRASFG